MPTIEKKLGRLIRTLFWIVGAIIVCAIAYIPAQEIAIYLNRSPQSAESAARTVFEMACERGNLNQHDFAGPEKIAVVNVPYAFLWRMRSDSSKTIEVDVSYLPYDLNYYFSASLARMPMGKVDRAL
jgi:hypothetical protein